MNYGFSCWCCNMPFMELGQVCNANPDWATSLGGLGFATKPLGIAGHGENSDHK